MVHLEKEKTYICTLTPHMCVNPPPPPVGAAAVLVMYDCWFLNEREVWWTGAASAGGCPLLHQANAHLCEEAKLKICQQHRGRSSNIQAHFGGSASRQEFVWLNTESILDHNLQFSCFLVFILFSIDVHMEAQMHHSTWYLELLPLLPSMFESLVSRSDEIKSWRYTNHSQGSRMVPPKGTSERQQ